MSRKLWRLECDLDDSIAHQVMSLIATSKKAFNVTFVPHGEETDTAKSAASPTDFVNTYLATVGDKFESLPLRNAAKSFGINSQLAAQVLARYATAGLLKRTGKGVFNKTAKGKVQFGTNAAAKPPKPKKSYKPKPGSVAAKVIKVLSGKKEPMAGADLAKAAHIKGKHENGVSVALSKLLQAGVVERPAPGQYVMAG